MKSAVLFSLLGVSLTLTHLNAQTWQTVTSGVPGGVTPSAVGAGNGNTIFAGFGGKGTYRSSDNGATWVQASSGLEFVAGDMSSVLPAAAYLQAGARILHGNAVGSWRNTVAPAAFYSDDNGASWKTAATPGVSLARFRSMVQLENYVFAADDLSGIVWRSSDNGANWEIVNNGVPRAPFIGFPEGIGHAVAVSGTRVLLLTKLWGVYASDNLGESWFEANNGIPVAPFSPLPFRTGADMVAAANGKVYAVVENGLWVSSNAGGSWTLASSGLPATTFRRLTSSGNAVFAATVTGQVFEIDAATDNIWGLPALSGMHQDALYVHNGFLYAGSVVPNSNPAQGALNRLQLSPGIRVNIEPKVVLQPTGAIRIVGQDHTFRVESAGTRPLSYQWQKDGANIAGATAQTLVLTNLAVANSGAYRVVVTGPGGSTTSQAAGLTVVSITPGALDPTFPPNTNATGKGTISGPGIGVYAIETMANGDVWLGGQWTAVRPATASGDAVRLNAALDIATDTGVSGVVNDVTFDSQGRVLLAGDFKHPATGSTTTNVLRYLANNTLDASFRANITGAVKVIEETPDGKYVVGGDIVMVQGTVRNKLARLNTDGALDASYDPFRTATVAVVNDLAVQSDGGVLVAGRFNVFSGQPSYLIRITPAGLIDTNFVAPVRGSFQQGYAVRVLPNGQILLGGSFEANETSTGQKNLMRLFADGSTDKSFNAGGVGLSGSLSAVRDIDFQPDGKILIAGDFNSYNGVARQGVLRLLADGSLDLSAQFPRSAQVTSGSVGRAVRATPDGSFIYAGFEGGGGTKWAKYLNLFDEMVFGFHPAAISQNKGAAVTLRSGFYSRQPVTYQWFKNGVAIAGATSSSLTLTNLVETDIAAYTVAATSAGATIVSSPGEVRVLAAPVIASAPVSLSILGGKRLLLEVDAFGQAPLSYQWRLNGTGVYSSAFDHTITGTNSFALTNQSIRFNESGSYQLIVSNSLGKATSSVQVAVIPQPAHLSPSYAGPSPGGSFGASLSGDNGLFVFGTNIFFFGVRADVGSSSLLGVARTDLNLRYDTNFIAPFDFFNYTLVSGGIVQSDGKVVIYGSFANWNGYSRIARLNQNGSLDTTFKTNGFPNQAPAFMALLPSDKFAIYGQGISTIGAHTSKHFAVYNADGSPDTEFKVTTGLGQFDQIRKMEGMADGKILVGGAFTSFDGKPASNFLRLNADGSLDTSWNVSINREVNDFDIGKDGRIAMVGGFSQVGSSNRTGLVVLLPNGAIDPSFAVTNALDINSFPPRSVAFDEENGVIVGGSATIHNGEQKSYFFRFTPEGRFDSEFIPDFLQSFEVNNLLSMPDGRIVFGNNAINYNGRAIGRVGILHGYPSVLGIVKNPLSQRLLLGANATLSVEVTATAAPTFQWYKNGQIIPGATGPTLQLTNVTTAADGRYSVRVRNLFRTTESAPARIIVLAAPVVIDEPDSVSARLGQTARFDVEAIGLGALTYQWQKNGTDISGATSTRLVLTNLSSGDAGLYRVVVFNSLAPQGVASAAAALSVSAATAGTVDISFHPGTGATSGSTAAAVQSVVWDSENKLVVGGYFNQINGVNKSYLARLNADGSVDATYNPGGAGPDNIVMNIGKGAGGKLYAAGWFANYNGTVAHRVVKLNADGTRDASFNNGAGQNPGAGTIGLRVVEDSSGKVYLGYSQSSPYLRRYNSNGTFDTFNFNGNSYTAIEAIVPLGSDRLIFGGRPFGINGAISRVLTNGTIDQTWIQPSPNIGNGPVLDIALLADGRILMGGIFNNMNNVAGVNNLALLATNGALVTNISSAFRVEGGAVNDIYVYPDGRILIGGYFSSVQGVNRPGLARLKADFALDTDFNPGSSVLYLNNQPGGISSIDVRSDGKIAVGGAFISIDGVPRNGIVVLNGESQALPLTIVSQPQNATVPAGETAIFSVAISGGLNPQFQWFKNDQPIAGATATSLLITNVAAADAGAYKVTVTSGAEILTSSTATLALAGATGTSFELWRARFSLPPAQSGPGDDPDNDRLVNVVEYMLGADPTQTTARPAARKFNSGGVDYAAITYTRLKDSTAYQLVVEASANVSFNAPIETTVVQTVDKGGGVEEVTVRANTPLAAGAKVFFRALVRPR